MTLNEGTHSWEDLIKERIKNDNLKSCTCKIYNQQLWDPHNSNELCSCGRLVRRHSFNGESIESKSKHRENVIWTPPNDYRVQDHSTKVPVDVHGSLKSSSCKFLRIDKKSKPEVIYKLLVDDCEGEAFKPSLILSVLGGAKYFTMTERLEKEVIQGIIDTANAVDAWILTTGVNTGVSKLVGEGMLHHRLLKDSPNKVKCIGLTKWGTITEDMRFELKTATEHYPEKLLERQIPENVQEDKETIEMNHTHCILFDDGNLNGYLGDSLRNKFVTEACKSENKICFGVTIIVEGGLGSLGSIENDIKKQRPIVLIQGSGRLADVLATLIEQTSNSEQNRQRIPTEEEIKKTIKQFFHNLSNSDILETTERIHTILKEQHHLLHVFSLDRGDNVSEIIFKAIFTVARTTNEMGNDKNQEQQSQSTEDKLVDLALSWNYIDGALPILKSRDQKKNIERNSDLFYESLIRNRPTFVQYFLVAGFDPLILLGRKKISDSPATISDVYKDSYSRMKESHQNCIKALFDEPPAKIVKSLDYKLNKFVGTFIESIYSSQNENYTKRVYIDMINHVCTCCKRKTPSNEKSFNQNSANSNKESVASKDKLLRDFFLWSVFMDMPEMAKTFLLHLQPRICAALIASAIFKRYAKASTTIDYKEKFHKQALEFEIYAATFINKCYQYNERLACELLLREIPLFGNVTCMQIAISNGSGKLVGTSCFHQTLSYVWYNKLSIVNRHLYTKPLQFLSILSCGLLAPLILSYREKEVSREADELLSSDGINYYMDKELSKNEPCKKYWNHFLYFHESPMIKVFYHFISYIGFLLVFSYMMLYHFDSPDTFKIPNWSEIYVIITVSTMLCEEVRKSYHDYKTRMTERWSSPGTALLTVFIYTFYILPYFLFYLGLAFRYRAYSDDILKTARIIWAFDLELWYLGSLKFIIVLKSVGPKLFMLKNMFKDLAGFAYIIFIAIAAYGVASRSLILYKQVPFTLTGILKEILYEPYWFIYGVVSDKDLLDEKTNNDTGPFVAEAAATHFLLAFHMLFINILILNLLIAVFTHTIDEVQENTDFHWRYQRYSFVREYFERPAFAYPPLIIFPHIVLTFLALRRECCLKLRQNQGNKDQTTKSKSSTPSFKMILKNSDPKHNRWDIFENAATHSYARSILEQNKKKNLLTTNDNYLKSTKNTNESNVIEATSDYQQIISNLNKEIMNIKAVVNENQKYITELHTHMKNHEQQTNESARSIMNAVTQVK